jgi:hypothetical protein
MQFHAIRSIRRSLLCGRDVSGRHSGRVQQVEELVRERPFSRALRYFRKIMLAGSVDSDIIYMAELIFLKCLNVRNVRKMPFLGQPLCLCDNRLSLPDIVMKLKSISLRWNVHLNVYPNVFLAVRTDSLSSACRLWFSRRARSMLMFLKSRLRVMFFERSVCTRYFTI